MNYKDESGKSHNIIQIYSYEYSPLFINSSLTEEQVRAIESCGIIKLADNTYKLSKDFDLAELNSLMMNNGFVFSNEVFCFLEDHLGEFGGTLFEKDHKPRKNPENPDYKYIYSNENSVKSLNTSRHNKYEDKGCPYKGYDASEDWNNQSYDYDSGYAVPKRRDFGSKPLNNNLNTGSYNPRRRYTGSEDETAGLWYDFD